MRYDLGIVGGLGPLASSLLYEMITKKTKAKKDQDHLNIALLSHAGIPDRNAFILGYSTEDPFPYLLNDCKLLEKIGVKMIVIPCNTACFFHKRLQNEVNVKVSNIVKQTVKYISKNGYKKVAILATEATIKCNLYQNELKKNGIDCVCPKNDLVMKIIFDYVKKGKKVPRKLIDDIVKDLNVDGYILGCTELSIVKRDLKLNKFFIDPMEILVDYVIKYFNV